MNHLDVPYGAATRRNPVPGSTDALPLLTFGG